MKKSPHPQSAQAAMSPSPAKTTQQADPTSILFRQKAYEIQIDTSHDPVRYWFAGKRGRRFTLIGEGEQRVQQCPVYMVFQGKDGPLATYRLTPAGQFIKVELP